MATINQGIMGGFSGTVGTVTGGKWNGLDCMRAKVAYHKDSKSSAQLDQRARFTILIKFLKPFKPFIKVGFKKRKPGTSAHNAAISCNFHHALTGISPDYSIDYSKVIVSQGTLPGVHNPVAIARVAGQIDFTWEANIGRLHAMANDKSILVAYNQEKEKVITSTGSNLRRDKNHSLTLPDDFAGDTIHCYIAFQNANCTIISDSQYAGTISL